MNQTHYEILKVLYDENKTSAVNSMRLKELMKVGNNKGILLLTPNSVYKQILKLNKRGLVDTGLRVGKENTYYITTLGIDTKNQLEGGQ